MLKVGLTGGIGTGKSSVSSLFNDWGAYIFDADLIAKEILNHDNTAQGEIIAEFGTDILNKEGSIERNKLARIAFQDENHQLRLNRNRKNLQQLVQTISSGYLSYLN